MNAHSPAPSLVDTLRNTLDALTKWRSEIEHALAHAGYSYTFDDITAMVVRQELSLYVHDDCFCLCQVIEFPRFKNFHFMIAGGKLESIIALKPEYERLAAALGCAHLSFSGRPGWARALKAAGWEHRFTTMWSPIEQGDIL